MNFELQTDRLFLRPLQESDVELLWPYVSDPELSTWMSWAPHQNKQECLEFIQRTLKGKENGTTITWGIFYKDQFCGIVSLEGFIRNMRAIRLDIAELGYWLGKEFRHQGIITEAAQAIIRFGFRKLGLHKIKVGHFSENIPSQKIIKKLGFKLVGEEKEHFLKYEKWHHHKIYEMLESNCSFL